MKALAKRKHCFFLSGKHTYLNQFGSTKCCRHTAFVPRPRSRGASSQDVPPSCSWTCHFAETRLPVRGRAHRKAHIISFKVLQTIQNHFLRRHTRQTYIIKREERSQWRKDKHIGLKLGGCAMLLERLEVIDISNAYLSFRQPSTSYSARRKTFQEGQIDLTTNDPQL